MRKRQFDVLDPALLQVGDILSIYYEVNEGQYVLEVSYYANSLASQMS